MQAIEQQVHVVMHNYYFASQVHKSLTMNPRCYCTKRYIHLHCCDQKAVLLSYLKNFVLGAELLSSFLLVIEMGPPGPGPGPGAPGWGPPGGGPAGWGPPPGGPGFWGPGFGGFLGSCFYVLCCCFLLQDCCAPFLGPPGPGGPPPPF